MTDQNNLPDEITADIGLLIERLRGHGIVVEGGEYARESFGNYYVELLVKNVRFRLIRDRSVYVLDGPAVSELKNAGLWRGFYNRQEFEEQVLSWIVALP